MSFSISVFLVSNMVVTFIVCCKQKSFAGVSFQNSQVTIFTETHLSIPCFTEFNLKLVHQKSRLCPIELSALWLTKIKLDPANSFQSLTWPFRLILMACTIYRICLSPSCTISVTYSPTSKPDRPLATLNEVQRISRISYNKLASLKATLVWNYDWATHRDRVQSYKRS